MTRNEFISNADKETLAETLCAITEDTANRAYELYDFDHSCCDICVASQYCYKGHCGFLDWLDKEPRFSYIGDFISWDGEGVSKHEDDS